MASVLHQELEDQVLVEQTDFLCEELGDPGRYLPDLRSRGILDYHDYQSIYGKVTNKEKVVELLSLVKGRRSRKGEHSFDVLVNALKRQRVQAHVAVSLEKALIQAKQERETSEPACSNTTYQHFPSSEHPYRQQSTEAIYSGARRGYDPDESSELGGQSESSYQSSNTWSSLSTATSSAFSYCSQVEAVRELEAQVEQLTIQLAEAREENQRKDALLREVTDELRTIREHLRH